MGLSFTSSTHSRHPYLTLFTAHASRTHVKAIQTDFPVKHDNSSGLTHDSPAERLLRTKVTFQPKTAPKKASRTTSRERRPQARHGPTPPLAHSGREPGPRPGGQHRNQDVIHLDAQSHGKSMESTERIPWLHASVTEASKAWSERLVSVSLSLERKIYLSFSLFIFYLDYPAIL